MVRRNYTVFDPRFDDDEKKEKPEVLQVSGHVAFIPIRKNDTDGSEYTIPGVERWTIPHEVVGHKYSFEFVTDEVRVNKKFRVYEVFPPRLVVVDGSMKEVFDQVLMRTHSQYGNAVEYIVPSRKELIVDYVHVPRWLSTSFSSTMSVSEMIILLCEANVYGFDPEKIEPLVRSVYEGRVNWIFQTVCDCFDEYIVRAVEKYDRENEKRLAKIMEL